MSFVDGIELKGDEHTACATHSTNSSTQRESAQTVTTRKFFAGTASSLTTTERTTPHRYNEMMLSLYGIQFKDDSEPPCGQLSQMREWYDWRFKKVRCGSGEWDWYDGRFNEARCGSTCHGWLIARLAKVWLIVRLTHGWLIAGLPAFLSELRLK